MIIQKVRQSVYEQQIEKMALETIGQVPKSFEGYIIDGDESIGIPNGLCIKFDVEKCELYSAVDMKRIPIDCVSFRLIDYISSHSDNSKLIASPDKFCKVESGDAVVLHPGNSVHLSRPACHAMESTFKTKFYADESLFLEVI
tara:strand:- start:8446 stop:8874 length:429 start_codon:yes stop_codon:yes gene_type:complete